MALVMLGTSLYNLGRYYLDRYLGIQTDNNPLGVLLAVVLIVAMVGTSFQLAIEMVKNSRYLLHHGEQAARRRAGYQAPSKRRTKMISPVW